MPTPSSTPRRRVAIVAADLVALVLLLAWWGRMTADGRIGSVGVLDQPVGTEVVLSLLTVVDVSLDGYIVGHSALRIPIVGDPLGLTLGEEITVGGVVEQGRVREQWREHAPARPAKRWLGLVGLATAGVLGATAIRLDRGGLVLRG